MRKHRSVEGKQESVQQMEAKGRRTDGSFRLVPQRNPQYSSQVAAVDGNLRELIGEIIRASVSQILASGAIAGLIK